MAKIKRRTDDGWEEIYNPETIKALTRRISDLEDAWHSVGQILWEGDWHQGSIVVPNIRLFHLVLCSDVKNNTFICSINNNFLQGVNTWAYPDNNNIVLYSLSASINNDTVIWSNCTEMTQTASGNNGSAIHRHIVRIIGVI